MSMNTENPMGYIKKLIEILSDKCIIMYGGSIMMMIDTSFSNKCNNYLILIITK